MTKHCLPAYPNASETGLDDLDEPDESNPRVEPSVLEAIVPEAEAGQRLDKVLATLFPQYSRSRLQQWC